ncbi:MAG TPA: cation:proton antiporter [Gemmatimonadaceae bacterium]|nr:cation:proton antiporter [Gemmatimonadaceae bacterium]
MEALGPAELAGVIGLIGLVVVIAAALSGPMDRVGVPQAAIFLALGALLGPHALGVLDFGFDSIALGAIVIVSLVLVLFSDSVAVDYSGVRRHATVAAVALGPGTLLTSLLIGGAGALLLDLPLPAALLLGAALGSTDPVMMRGLLRQQNVPQAASFALRVESGLNDLVVLPIVLLAMAFMASGGALATGEAIGVSAKIFLIGPAVGAAVGYASVRLLELVRGRFGMRRDYEALYVIGVAFSAYASAELLHGSGFMAAFSAGFTIALLDVELCDCFTEYGQATSEMFLLLAFVAFGASLIWLGLDVIDLRTAGFALFAVLVRSAVMALALGPMKLSPMSRRLVVWYGPRGLNSLLLVLLPVFAGVPGGKELFPIAALVVLVSLVFHGTLLVKLTRDLPAREVTSELAVPVVATGAGLVASDELITFDEVERLRAAGEGLVILDVRTGKSYDSSDARAAGSVRIPPDRVIDSAASLALPRNAWLAAYCA